MTAADPLADFRLPFRYWSDRRTPQTQRDALEWALEGLVSIYSETDDEHLLDIAHRLIAPHLTWSQFHERVQRLCGLSAAAAEWDDRGSIDARDAYREDYVRELSSLVQDPRDFDRHADQAVELVDELAARRNR